jgi:hypothetical protein
MNDNTRDDDINAPYSRKIAPEKGKPDQMPDEGEAKNHQEELIDEAGEETFPARDPATPKRIT